MNISLQGIGELSAPITKLIETVGAGVGAVYAPVNTILHAKADAKAAIIRAEGMEQIVEIEARAKQRIEYLEALRQQNIEQIVSGASKQLPQTVSAEPVSKDWTLQFLDTAKDVCDEEMQKVWANILAGEVVKPGTVSKRTLQFVKTLDKSEAIKFSELSQYAFFDPENLPILIWGQPLNDLFGDSKEFLKWYLHLKTIGLLEDHSHTYSADLPRDGVFTYFNRKFRLTRPEKEKSSPQLISCTQLTKLGVELYYVSRPSPVAGFPEKLIAYHKSLGNCEYFEEFGG